MLIQKLKRKRGRVRFMATVLKTVDPKGSVSSNLTVSTMVFVVKRLRPRIVIPIYVGSNPIKHPKDV